MPRDKDETRQPRVARCSFCDKTQDQVRRIIAGNGVYICDECIALCQEIIADDLGDGADARSRRICPSPPKSRRCSTNTWSARIRPSARSTVAVYNHYQEDQRA